MDSYIEHCNKPIPIGVQKYAYQCENMSIEPIHGAVSILAYPPTYSKGKEPYPNTEKDVIEKYTLKIEKHTANSVAITLRKKFNDKSEETFLTITSFSDLVNRLFENQPANVWKTEPPVIAFLNDEPTNVDPNILIL